MANKRGNEPNPPNSKVVEGEMTLHDPVLDCNCIWLYVDGWRMRLEELFEGILDCERGFVDDAAPKRLKITVETLEQ